MKVITGTIRAKANNNNPDFIFSFSIVVNNKEIEKSSGDWNPLAHKRMVWYNDKEVQIWLLQNRIIKIIKVNENGKAEVIKEYLPAKKLLNKSECAFQLHLNTPDNFSLLFHKFPYLKIEEQKLKPALIESGKNKIVFYDISKEFQPDTNLLKAWIEKNKNTYKGLYSDENRIDLQLTTTHRVHSGIGSQSIYETGIHLHHTLGIPYLPATGLRGAVRSAIIVECFGRTETSKSLAFKNPLFAALFGKEKDKEYNDEDSGALVFSEGFPGSVKVHTEVTTVHSKSYYEGDDWPTGQENPNPIFQLSASGVFHLHIGIETSFAAVKGKSVLRDFPDWEKLIPEGNTVFDEKLAKVKEDCNLKNFVSLWTQKALLDFGVGAKTRIGFGKLKSDAA